MLALLPRFLALPVLAALGSFPLGAQQVNPADKQREQAEAAKGLEQEPKMENPYPNTWEMPPTIVRAFREGQLREEDRIGSYGQPRWTAKRLFPSTRVYVVPEGKVEFEWWTRAKVPDEGPSTVETQYELELGLPHRFQLDLYYVTSKTGSEGELDTAEQKYEIRYALADWGKIWMNPTLYFEYVSRDAEADKLEYKLLLGDELGEGWHFGSNLVFEHELGGALENEYELTAGIARTVIDEKFSIGAELKAALTDTHADRGDFEESLEIGPSFRYQPLPQMHIDFAPLIGIGGDSRAADIFLVVGWEL
jgi:hypothetical protein